VLHDIHFKTIDWLTVVVAAVFAGLIALRLGLGFGTTSQ
jgi:hypothetical protein